MRWLQRAVAVKNVVRNVPGFLYNWTAGFVVSPVQYTWEEPPINLAHVINVLNVVHAHEIFQVCLWCLGGNHGAVQFTLPRLTRRTVSSMLTHIPATCCCALTAVLA